MRDDRRFYDATQNSFLHQHVDEATRFRGSNIPSLLDLVLTKNEFEIEHIEYQTSFGNSDHCVLFFNFTLEGVLTPEEHDVPKPKIFKGDYPGMSNIFQTEWQVNNSQKDPQGKWDVLHNLYKIASERFIPIGHSSGNTPRNKWMTRKALQAIDIKENKWNVYKDNQTDTNLEIYNHARNASVAAVREAKYNFEKSLAEEVKNRNTRGFYAYIRSVSTC